jgi:hypothetical protein
MKKRWLAIEPHWRVLYANGTATIALSRGETVSLSRLLSHRRLGPRFCPAVAIIKVTPK